MYAAKTAGPSSSRFFADEMNVAASAKLELESDLRRAIAGEGLQLYFQPKVDLATGRVIGAEALVRWQHPRRGLLTPLQFVPLAEECGLIVALGDWVVAAAAAQLRAWTEAGIETVCIAVNLASPSFQQPDIVDRLVGIVRRAGVAPRQIVLDLTESLLMVDGERTIAVLDRLREQGFGLALDDFGTGYSSLGYLKRFPLDELKIDRSFVSDASGDSKDAAIVLSIIELGRHFGMRVVAEGVETAEQARFLLAKGCPIQQGFLFSRPLPAADFSALLQSGRGNDFRRQLAAAG
ncbi:MAG: Bacteriophytochrome cph2 [Candidatus Accumulibacter adjunctus]|uniref:Bacteriophytochrome cph2 n=1 Tax=Candidatus Accumulibacter adjunctus TaxID=1454001 RepID=A0A011PP23_9PROT|nr:MAG: Bacteriophytochrome cph2 [Candidatus Accumulibacter adjunctus]